jgi:hypothetical protein
MPLSKLRNNREYDVRIVKKHASNRKQMFNVEKRKQDSVDNSLLEYLFPENLILFL